MGGIDEELCIVKPKQELEFPIKSEPSCLEQSGEKLIEYTIDEQVGQRKAFRIIERPGISRELSMIKPKLELEFPIKSEPISSGFYGGNSTVGGIDEKLCIKPKQELEFPYINSEPICSGQYAENSIVGDIDEDIFIVKTDLAEVESPADSESYGCTSVKYQGLNSSSFNDVQDVPLRDDGGISEHEISQLPQGEWGICIEDGLPPSSVSLMQLNPENGHQFSLDSGTTVTNQGQGLGTVSVNNEAATEAELDGVYYDDNILQCSLCHKVFEQKIYFRAHIQRHIAAAKFRTILKNRRFNKEIMTNKSFQCKVCSRQFNFACDLTAHSRTHTGDKPYWCDTCGKLVWLVQKSLHTEGVPQVKTPIKGESFRCGTCRKELNTASAPSGLAKDCENLNFF